MKRARILILIPLLAIGAYVGFLLGDRLPPYEHDYGTISPANPTEGQDVEIEWTMKKINRICPGWVQRQIYDKDNVLICNYGVEPAIRREQLYSQQGSDGPPNRLNRVFKLCDRARAGPATYRAFTCYQCNWLEEMYPIRLQICQYTPDVNFMIGPQPAGPMGPH